MKMFAWIFSLSMIGMLSGCGDKSDQSSMLPAELAVSKMAAVQAALDQVIDARNAIKQADDDKALALENARNKHEAVQAAIALATKESEILKKEAAIRTSLALKTHERAMASRKTLLLAALAQSKTKQILLEREKAVENARIQNMVHQHDAQVAMLNQLKAERLLKIVVEAERLAALSINLVAPDSFPVAKNNTEKKLIVTVAEKPVVTKKVQKKTTPIVKKHIAKKPHKAPVQLAKTSIPDSDATRGHGLAQKCQRCHTFEPNQKGKFGPNLFGVVGEQAGKSQDYKYGAALAKADFTWDEKNLEAWICNSGKSIKKLTGKRYAITKMSTQKVCGQDAKDVVAYLRTLKSHVSATTTTTGS